MATFRLLGTGAVCVAKLFSLRAWNLPSVNLRTGATPRDFSAAVDVRWTIFLYRFLLELRRLFSPLDLYWIGSQISPPCTDFSDMGSLNVRSIAHLRLRAILLGYGLASPCVEPESHLLFTKSN